MSAGNFNQQEWAHDFLGRLGDPVTTENVVAIIAWENAEGGHFVNNATFNPLNTTLQAPGSHPINVVPGTAGVQAYPDYETGMKATLDTINSFPYAAIRASLAAGNSPAEVTAAAIAASPWGTGPLALAAIPGARKMINDTSPGISEGVTPGLNLPIPDPLDAAKSALEILTKAAAWTANRHNWIRILEVIAGGVGMIVAIFLISGDLRTVTAASVETATKAAVAA